MASYTDDFPADDSLGSIGSDFDDEEYESEIEGEEGKCQPMRLFLLSRAASDDASIVSVLIRAKSERQVCRYILAHPEASKGVLDSCLWKECGQVKYTSDELLERIEQSDYAGGPMYDAYSLKEVKDDDVVVVPSVF